MEDKIIKKIKLVVTVLIVVLFVWFLIINPLISFKGYEKQMREAAERYFQLNSYELPTGERTKTLTLQDLYYKAFVKEDFYIPYTDEPCSLKESWVKVKKVDNEYKYFVYLKCGVLQSTIDHKGPVITLKGDESMTIGKGEKYKEPGIEKVIDAKDGTIDIKDVEIKGKVNTDKVGTYEIKYIAFDKLKNKTEVIRKVEVVEKLSSTVKNATNKTGYYTGANPNNYIYLSKMLFRIVKLDGKNVVIVADEDVTNVNYDGIDEWLDYYYEHIDKRSKVNSNNEPYLVKNRYCNMKLTDTTLDTTECSSYTKERYAYIPSVTDVNLAQTNEGNYLRPHTMSWLANTKDKNKAYLTRDFFFGEFKGKNFGSFDKTHNYGVRPMLTLKGDLLIKSGDGTKEKPYSFNEIPTAKGGEYVNTRVTGEYLTYSGMLWRIIETEKDGTTKIIAQETLADETEPVTYYYDPDNKTTIYNPEEKGNVGYHINNRATEFINTSYFVNHEIKVPIYKNKIQYNKEVSTKKYNVKLSAPNMYEMFSTFNEEKDETMQGHWLINSSKEKYMTGAMTDVGVVLNEKTGVYSRYAVRPVGYLKKNIIITSGKGTRDNPYVIAK